MEDVNFPLDQGQTSTALRGLQESREANTRPRRPGDNEEVRNREQVREEEDVEQTAQAERTVIREDRVDVTEQSRQQNEIVVEDRESQDIQQETSEDSQTAFRNPRSQGAAGANELSRISEGAVRDPDERLREDVEASNDISNPDRINEFETRNQIDSVEEGAQIVADEATSVEQENPSRPLGGTPSIRDVAENGGAGTQGRESLEESFNADPPSPTERSATQLEQRPANDARVQQRIQEERVEDAELRVRNEPAIETPAQTIDPVEAPEEPLAESFDNNPLRGPRPSELRDESDASATETERGQNISSLI